MLLISDENKTTHNIKPRFSVISMDVLRSSIAKVKRLSPKPSVKIIDADRREYFLTSSTDSTVHYYQRFVDTIDERGNWQLKATCLKYDPCSGTTGDFCRGFMFYGKCYHLAAASAVDYGTRKMVSDAIRNMFKRVRAA